MSILRLLVTGAAVAAGVHYATKKRPDGSSFVDDLKAKAPEWKEKAQPYVDQVKEQWAKVTGSQENNTNSNYANKFNNYSSDPDSSYTS